MTQRRRLTTLAAVILFMPYVCVSQSLTARIYPEKSTFLFGEPIYLVLEVENVGQNTARVDSRFGYPCGYDTIEVLGVKQMIPGIHFGESCFGGYAGSCGSSLVELKPGKIVEQRILLNALFQLDHPGTYDIRGNRQIPIYADTTYPVSYVDAKANFAISVTNGDKRQLNQAFKRYVEDLSSTDASVRFEAMRAITETAPAFMEDVILHIADMPDYAGLAAAALGKLNSKASLKKLIDLSLHSERDGTRQAAIFALAKTRNQSLLTVFRKIAEARPRDDGLSAVANSGFLGASAIPFLREKLLSPDANMRVAAIHGLGTTASRSAVPVLIGFLNGSQGDLVREARIALAQLTHYSVGTDLFLDASQTNEFDRWRAWWKRQGSDAEIFDTSHCSQPRSLPMK